MNPESDQAPNSLGATWRGAVSLLASAEGRGRVAGGEGGEAVLDTCPAALGAVWLWPPPQASPHCKTLQLGGA